MIEKFIQFKDVAFTYPPLREFLDADGSVIEQKPVFEHFNAVLPGGFTSLVGQNGSGKSTFMLLAAGRMAPSQGSVHLLDKDIASMNETDRNLMASFIYQNMEFDTADETGDLLNQVFLQGGWNNPGGARDFVTKTSGKDCVVDCHLLEDCVRVFELDNLLERPLNVLSKGEMQRVLLAFSLLYGCASIFMDEPMFAMEAYQKNDALSFLKAYSEKYRIPLYISMHEIDLTKKYAQNVLLFYPNRDLAFGTPKEVLVDAELEKAYGVPCALLKQAEDASRANQLEESIAIADLKSRTES